MRGQHLPRCMLTDCWHRSVCGYLRMLHRLCELCPGARTTCCMTLHMPTQHSQRVVCGVCCFVEPQAVFRFARRTYDMLHDYDMWGSGFSSWPEALWRRSALQVRRANLIHFVSVTICERCDFLKPEWLETHICTFGEVETSRSVLLRCLVEGCPSFGSLV